MKGNQVKKPADVCVVETPIDAGSEARDSARALVNGAVSGTLVGFAEGGAPLVEVAIGSTCARFVARTCVELHVRDLWKKLVVLFDESNPDSPFVLGVLQTAGELSPDARYSPPPQTREIEVDGRAVALSAQESITLQCGEASITLRRDGRIVIRGKNVVSHASGVNRIRGGSVQLN